MHIFIFMHIFDVRIFVHRFDVHIFMHILDVHMFMRMLAVHIYIIICSSIYLMYMYLCTVRPGFSRNHEEPWLPLHNCL